MLCMLCHGLGCPLCEPPKMTPDEAKEALKQALLKSVHPANPTKPGRVA